jgi:hypothetical protein
MPLEDPNCIDIIIRSEEGKPCLVITDSGLTTDPEQRFTLLINKLMHYVGYILSEDFKQEYPGLKPGDVTIRVLCALDPTEKMARFAHLINPEDETESIRIEYEIFEGSRTSTEMVSDDKEAARGGGGVGKLWNPRSVDQWIWGFVCVGLVGSAVYRVAILKQSPMIPLLILLMLWSLRIYSRRRRWERMKADMIARGVSPEYFKNEH